MNYIIESIDFQRYQLLAEKMLAMPVEIAVIDMKDGPLWVNSGWTEKQVEHMQAALFAHSRKEMLAAKTGEQGLDLGPAGNSGFYFSSLPLCSCDSTRLAFYLGGAAVADHAPQPAANLVETMRIIADHVAVEYNNVSDLANITEELTERYEELNLVYDDCRSATQSATNSGFQALVDNCLHYMGVDQAIIMLPDKRIVEFAGKSENPDAATTYIKILSANVYPWMVEHDTPLVVNDENSQYSRKLGMAQGHHWVCCPIHDAAGEVTGLIALLKKTSGKRFSNSDKNICAIMAHKAGKMVQTYYDDLTGIFRRAELEEKIKFVIEKILPLNESCSFIALNIERMHVINECYGMSVGDQLIKTVSQTIQTQLRQHDILGRVGGDVFGVLARHCNTEQAQVIASKLLHGIGGKPLEVAGHEIPVEVVVAVVPMRSQDDARHVLNCSETSLEVASARGGNRVEVYAHHDRDVAKREQDIHWVTKVQAALREDRFELFCQGIFSVDDLNFPQHYEVLLRLRDEQGRFVSPDTFLPAAKNYRLMANVDRWVVENTIRQLAENSQHIHDEKLTWAVNLSGQTLSNPEFSSQLAELLTRYQLSARRLGFEITEGETIENIEDAQQFIALLRSMGCKTYLDDFGTGLSSFSYMQQLAFDYVKIDGSFIKSVANDPVSRSMVESICNVASVIGLNIVAEYVESTEMIPLLRELGITHLQGYGLHAPESMGQILSAMSHVKKAV